MKCNSEKSVRSGVIQLVLLAVFVCMIPILLAEAPPWWRERGVARLDAAGNPIDAKDYAAASQGQLKEFAVSAYEEFLAKIPAELGGIGAVVPPPNPAESESPANRASPGWRIRQLVSQWVVLNTDGTVKRDLNGKRVLVAGATSQKDFATINLGQLKAVAAPFYDRLIALGMDTKASLIAHGYPASWAHAYPWNPNDAWNKPLPPGTQVDKTANYVPANLGQLKMVFSFDIDLHYSQDTDHDGIPDWWEFAHHLNPYDARDAAATSAVGELTNLVKYTRGLDPAKLDTDGDGMRDSDELTFGTDPLNSASFALAVRSSIPKAGSYGHPPNDAIVLYFTLPLPASFSISSIRPEFVQYSSDQMNWTPVAGTTAILPGRKALVFTPYANLHPRLTNSVSMPFNYRITCSEETIGISGVRPFSSAFATLPQHDFVGPWVVKVLPGENYVEVSRDFIPTVQWSQPLSPATILASNVSLRAAGGTLDLPVTVAFDYDTNRLKIAPAARLLADTSYTITLGVGFTGLRGMALVSPFIWSFRTQPDPVLPVAGGGPSIAAITPQPYANDVEVYTSVSIAFSEAMNPSTLSPQNIHLRAHEN